MNVLEVNLNNFNFQCNESFNSIYYSKLGKDYFANIDITGPKVIVKCDTKKKKLTDILRNPNDTLHKQLIKTFTFLFLRYKNQIEIESIILKRGSSTDVVTSQQTNIIFENYSCDCDFSIKTLFEIFDYKNFELLMWLEHTIVDSSNKSSKEIFSSLWKSFNYFMTIKYPNKKEFEKLICISNLIKENDTKFFKKTINLINSFNEETLNNFHTIKMMQNNFEGRNIQNIEDRLLNNYTDNRLLTHFSKKIVSLKKNR